MIGVEDVQQLSQSRDPEGWLSLYLTCDPSSNAGADERADGASLRLRSHIDALLGWLERSGQETLLARVRERLAQLTQRIAELDDPRRPGIGRALFIGLSDTDSIYEFDLPGSVGTSAWLDESPCVRKLLCSIERSRPAGVVVADSEHVKIYEWHPRSLQIVQEIEFVSQLDHNDPDNWSTGKQKFEQASVNEHRRWLESSAKQVCSLAGQWDEIIIVAPPEITDCIRSACPQNIHYLELGANHVRTPLSQLMSMITQCLAEHRRADRSHLIGQIIEQSQSGGLALTGPSAVLRALDEGRVETLVYDTDARPHFDHTLAKTDGKIESDGYHGVERLIQQALATRAQVVVVDGTNAEALADHGSVAAKLRW